MFGIGGGQILIILIVALLVFGPKRLPELGASLGKTIKEFRKSTQGITDSVVKPIKELTDELAKPIKDINNEIKQVIEPIKESFDGLQDDLDLDFGNPLQETMDSVRGIGREIGSSFDMNRE